MVESSTPVCFLERSRGSVPVPHFALPRPVVEVRVPRGPSAVEGERQLLVVLVFLAPHPKGGEHDLRTVLRFRTTRRSRAGAARGGGTPCATSRASGSAALTERTSANSKKIQDILLPLID